MIIWILDNDSGNVLRINPLPKTREEISIKYNGNVEDWLDDNAEFIEEQLGICLDDCSYMATDERGYRSIHF